MKIFRTNKEIQQLKDQLNWSNALRDIHIHDAVEIEELYRMFVFPHLPRLKGREKLLANLIGTSVGEAIYIVESLHESLKVPGSICEFGVAQGATSQLLAHEILKLDRQLYLFDSFEGLPQPTKEDVLIDDIFGLGSMQAYQGTMASPESEVLEKLDEIKFPMDRLTLMKGWVNDTLKQNDAPQQIAFAYLDFDFYEPIKQTLEYLKKTLPVGGRVVVDDYGFFSDGAQKAVDEFVASNSASFEFRLPLDFAGHFAILERTR